MIRITGGDLRGRNINSPSGKFTRPTGAKVRQALFNILGEISGPVLDLYAGSGIVGFEALSRGASTVDFVEKDPRTAALIKNNAQLLKVNATVHSASVSTWITAATPGHYDLIYADPPFTEAYPDLRSVLTLKSPGGVLVCEMPTRNLPPWSSESSELRRYGESTLALFF